MGLIFSPPTKQSAPLSPHSPPTTTTSPVEGTFARDTTASLLHDTAPSTATTKPTPSEPIDIPCPIPQGDIDAKWAAVEARAQKILHKAGCCQPTPHSDRPAPRGGPYHFRKSTRRSRLKREYQEKLKYLDNFPDDHDGFFVGDWVDSPALDRGPYPQPHRHLGADPSPFCRRGVGGHHHEGHLPCSGNTVHLGDNVRGVHVSPCGSCHSGRVQKEGATGGLPRDGMNAQATADIMALLAEIKKWSTHDTTTILYQESEEEDGEVVTPRPPKKEVPAYPTPAELDEAACSLPPLSPARSRSLPPLDRSDTLPPPDRSDTLPPLTSTPVPLMTSTPIAGIFGHHHGGPFIAYRDLDLRRPKLRRTSAVRPQPSRPSTPHNLLIDFDPAMDNPVAAGPDPTPTPTTTPRPRRPQHLNLDLCRNMPAPDPNEPVCPPPPCGELDGPLWPGLEAAVKEYISRLVPEDTNDGPEDKRLKKE